MQTCSICNASSPDEASQCKGCGAELDELSTTAHALTNFLENPRVRAVTISSSESACSYCHEQLGTYPVDAAPNLPHKGCSHTNGCRCFYIPVLTDIYP